MRLLVYFDGQFWTGLFESSETGEYYAHRHVFGKNPSDCEILALVNSNDLFRKSNEPDASANEITEHKRINPKRLQRLAAREVSKSQVSTKSQEALQQQMEQQKKEKEKVTKEQREALKERKREIATEKAKQKHRGH